MRDLERLPPTELGSLDPAAIVLRPDVRSIVRRGERRLAARATLAAATGGLHRFNRRVVEPRFKPVQWVVAEGVPIGYSAADIALLGRYGALWLERAGVGRHDVVVSVLPGGPNVAHWQLALGCRRAGVSALHLDPSAASTMAQGLAPSVLVGDPQHLMGLLADHDQEHAWPNLRTIIAVGDPLSAALRERLRSAGGGAAVVGAWAPPGVRAMWSECRAGSALVPPSGYHAFDDDVLEVVGSGDEGGELIWTGVRWRGSALVRLRTYVRATVERTTCPGCGARSARIVPLAPMVRSGSPTASPPQPAPPLAEAVAPVGPSPDVSRGPVASPVDIGIEAILDAESDVAAWQVERRVVDGTPETIVVIAPAWGAATAPLVRRLDRYLRATQFIVLSAEEVAARVDRAGGERVLGEGP